MNAAPTASALANQTQTTTLVWAPDLTPPQSTPHTPHTMDANQDMPYKTIDEFIAYFEKLPAQQSPGSAGHSFVTH
jgi:hypothetical protein